MSKSENNINSMDYRSVMGLWPTGVSVVSGQDSEGEHLGMVIGSFTSVSIEPALVAFCPQKSSVTWQKMKENKNLCINFLSDRQSDICWKFASGELYGRFESLDYTTNSNDIAEIPDCSAWLDVTIDNIVDGGDHDIVVCRINALRKGSINLPMAFSQGQLCSTKPITNLPVDHLDQWEQSIHSIYQ